MILFAQKTRKEVKGRRVFFRARFNQNGAKSYWDFLHVVKILQGFGSRHYIIHSHEMPCVYILAAVRQFCERKRRHPPTRLTEHKMLAENCHWKIRLLLKNAIIYYSWCATTHRKKRQVNLFSSRYKRKSVIRRGGDAFRKLPLSLKQPSSLSHSTEHIYISDAEDLCASVVGFIHKGGDSAALPWAYYILHQPLCKAPPSRIHICSQNVCICGTSLFCQRELHNFTVRQKRARARILVPQA